MLLIFLLFSLWDAKIEDKIVQDRIGMNLLYVQVNFINRSYHCGEVGWSTSFEICTETV